MRKLTVGTIAAGVCCYIATPSQAEVITAAADHYQLAHEAKSSLAPDALWQRVLNVSEWWLADHSYSGDADNLSLEAKAGGQWREDWETGSVIHGTVLYIENDGPIRTIRLDAPFGPLQDMAVTVRWTISVKADEKSGGSIVVFKETANGSSISNLDKIAPAVNGVKTAALKSLVTVQTD